MLRMSENLAGVTLLAFGNGSPDIFASIANTHGDTELIYTELIGAAAFVTGCIAGFIILVRPFKIVRRNYIRDVSFFLLTAFIIDFNIHNQEYSLIEGFATVSIYIFYIIYVVADHIFMKQKVAKLKRSSFSVSISGGSVAELEKQAEDLEETLEIQIKSRKDSSIILTEEMQRVFTFRSVVKPNDDLLQTFLKSLNPIELDEWRKSKKLLKVMMVIKVSLTSSLKG